MKVIIKRPKGIKRGAPGLIDRQALRALKRSEIHFAPFKSKYQYPKVRTVASLDGAVDATFKAVVESLLQDNAELLRRLAR